MRIFYDSFKPLFCCCWPNATSSSYVMLFADCGFILMPHDMSTHSLPHSSPPFTHVCRNKQPNAVVGTSLARHTSRGLVSPPLLSDNTKLEVPSSICHNVGARSELDSSCARFSLFFAACLFFVFRVCLHLRCRCWACIASMTPRFRFCVSAASR